MIFSKVYDKIASSSPYVELIIRNIYWSKIRLLKKYRGAVKFSIVSKDKKLRHCDFFKVLDFLEANGMKKGSLVIAHSSFDGLKDTGMQVSEIVDSLLNRIGHQGTLAMPVIRRFKGEPKMEDRLLDECAVSTYKYNVQSTTIISGLIPYELMQNEGSCTSRFPYNPMTAKGPLAQAMMEHNLDGEYPSPHGPNSSWKFCLDHDAVIIGLGIDLGHHITMVHVGEESFPFPIPPEEWFDKHDFEIIDGNEKIEKTVHNRKAKWGLLHFAEKTLVKDLRKNYILKEAMIDGVMVGILSSRDLIDFILSKRNEYPTYPYFKCKHLKPLQYSI